jgi:hypothetical protein
MTKQPQNMDQEKRIEKQAKEEVTDPRLLLDNEGDAAPPSGHSNAAPYDVAEGETADGRIIRKGERERPGPTRAEIEGAPRMGETHARGGDVARDDGLLQTNQVDSQGLPGRSNATPATAMASITPGRDEPERRNGPDDGGYGVNRDRERSMNEPGDFAPDAPIERTDPVAAGGRLRQPSPGAGQPTGTPNTWRERGGDDRVVGDDNRQYNSDGISRAPRTSADDRPSREKSASIDVGTDETGGDR